ncbi:hypothetical protein, partial [Mesorhizobium sp. M1D.F.Ca.ET.183.01.1.1]|uniref:hypothetical protein n=1 Tax=Mesorhizobium sp. M1D.F.Ca.ET.183.01.1.1 TaxID=2496666 RepID=UPI001AEDB367
RGVHASQSQDSLGDLQKAISRESAVKGLNVPVDLLPSCLPSSGETDLRRKDRLKKRFKLRHDLNVL